MPDAPKDNEESVTEEVAQPEPSNMFDAPPEESMTKEVAEPSNMFDAP